jgi:PAS domain S-box-containing protein
LTTHDPSERDAEGRSSRRRLAEKALQAAEERLGLVMAAGAMGLWELDLLDHSAYRSLQHDRIFGYESLLPEWTYEMFLDHVLPEDRAMVDRKFQAAVSTRSDWGFECRIRRADGEIRWVWAVGHHRQSDSDHPVMAGLVQDITDRKQAETELRESADRLSLALDVGDAGIWEWNIEADEVRFDSRFHALLGYEPGELPTSLSEWMPYHHPADVPVWMGKAEAYLRGESAAYESEYRIRNKAGQWDWVFTRGKIVKRDPAGAPQEFIGVAMNVTGRKRVEEALRESEERYRWLFNAMDEGFCIVEVIFDDEDRPVDYVFLEVNAAFEEQTGLIDAQGKRMRELAPAHEEYWFETYGEIALTGRPARFVNRAEQLHRWYDVYAFRFGQPEDRQVAILFNDITERKHAEESLVESQEQLRQSQKMEAVGQLAGGIAHDFNNLLTAILGYSEMILASETSCSDDVRLDVAEIKHAAERAGALTKQILAFSRRQTLRPEVVSLNEVLSGLETLLRRTLGEDVDLVCMQGVDLGHAEIDVHQFEQVLMNLALNARDAMPSGGKLVIETANAYLGEEYWLTHSEAKPGSYVMLAVTDTGIGMDEATRERIFEPFFTTKPTGEGTGLGLATVYGIVKQSGGNIFVRSDLGKGTTFKIYLPRVAMRP